MFEIAIDIFKSIHPFFVLGLFMKSRLGYLFPDRYFKDRKAPELISFKLDVDGDGVLFLNFSEPVDPWSFNASRVVLRSSAPASAAPVVHPSAVPTNRPSPVPTSTPSLCPTYDTPAPTGVPALLTAAPSTTDAPSVAPSSVASAYPSPAPTVAVELELNYASSFQATGVTTLEVRLLRDLFYLKQAISANPSVATIGESVTSTFLTADAGYVTDRAFPGAANDAPLVFALQAAAVISDTTGPRLVNFEIDVASQVLALYFDEPISVDAFNASAHIRAPRNLGVTFRVEGINQMLSPDTGTCTSRGAQCEL